MEASWVGHLNSWLLPGLVSAVVLLPVVPAAPGEDGHELGVDEGGQGDTGVGQAAPAGPSAHPLLSRLQEYSTVK